MSLFSEAERSAISNALSGLERDVEVRLELGAGEEAVTVLAGAREVDVGAEARRIVEEVAALSDRVLLQVDERPAGEGLRPALRIGDGLVYHGVPWGYELATLVGAIAACGTAAPGLSDGSLEALRGLEQDVEVEVAVTPT